MEYFSALKETIAALVDDAKSQLQRVQIYQNEYYDQKANADEFRIKDSVLDCEQVTKISANFEKHFKGSCSVEEGPVAGGVACVLLSGDAVPIGVRRGRVEICYLPLGRPGPLVVVEENPRKPVIDRGALSRPP